MWEKRAGVLRAGRNVWRVERGVSGCANYQSTWPGSTKVIGLRVGLQSEVKLECSERWFKIGINLILWLVCE